MFTKDDLARLSERSISKETALKQMEIFARGIPFARVTSPCIPGSGIDVAGEKERQNFGQFFDREIKNYSVCRFVPASGAASRMFKDLFAALEELTDHRITPAGLEKSHPLVAAFLENLQDYAFFSDLESVLNQRGTSYEKMMAKRDYQEILRLILLPEGLNYGNLPKALLKFHSYGKQSKTAFEEQLREAKAYLYHKNAPVHMHFTVSPEHRPLFEAIAAHLTRKEYRSFRISFSEQKPSTDTLAADSENMPFRDPRGNLVFRPGGHGALLENLNELNEEIVFIGNIDNIPPENKQEERVLNKKYLGGFLLEKVHQVRELLAKIDKGTYSDALRTSVLNFARNVSPWDAERLKILPKDDFIASAYTFLHRPVRVCGMVKNIGEPGGGPFWVMDENGKLSRQIVESSQVNLTDPDQKKVFESSSHFNPVDLVCCIKDHKGEKFRLEDFRDDNMAFISSKSQGGKVLKALELPGLWNGSMAGWLTWFVDIPVDTFTPVKTVFDLVRPEHRS